MTRTLKLKKQLWLDVLHEDRRQKKMGTEEKEPVQMPFVFQSISNPMPGFSLLHPIIEKQSSQSSHWV